jgi:hypothetical protein
MVRPFVRVYIEGGAKGRIADSDFRCGWKKFLRELHELARQHGYGGLEVVRGTGRENTYERFTHNDPNHARDLRVLLVDSEMAVPDGSNVWDIVARREGDRWHCPGWATENHLYLMVHFVETWLLTDQVALQRFFRRGFNTAVLPTTELENRSKNEIERALERATRNSNKGSYQHVHAHAILEMVDPERVKTLYHGRRLFNTLGELIRGRLT